MRWPEIRQTYPEQWLVVEALDAHTEENHRVLDRIAVVEVCPDGAAAMKSYRRLHQQYPTREFYFVHTARENLDIKERWWMGIRRNDAACVDRGFAIQCKFNQQWELLRRWGEETALRLGVQSDEDVERLAG